MTHVTSSLRSDGDRDAYGTSGQAVVADSGGHLVRPVYRRVAGSGTGPVEGLRRGRSQGAGHLTVPLTERAPYYQGSGVRLALLVSQPTRMHVQFVTDTGLVDPDERHPLDLRRAPYRIFVRSPQGASVTAVRIERGQRECRCVRPQLGDRRVGCGSRVVTDTLRRSEAAPSGRGERAFPLLEGYRALAAAFVVATHAGFQTGASLRGAWAGPLARMDFGVALFFVLSGFLLFRPHAAVHLVGRSAPQTVPYLKRRALRILPAYWVVVVVAMVVFAENRQLGIRDWLVQLLLLQTYVPNGLVTGLQQMWSLGTEVAFYLALPLIGLLVRRLPGRTVARRAAVQLGFLGVLASIAIVYRLVVFDHTVYGRAQYWLPGYLDWFAVGMALATVYTLVSSGEPLPRWAAGTVDVARAPGACFAAGAAVLWVSTARIAGPYDLTPPTVSQALFKHVSYAVAAGLLLAPATIRPHPGGAFAAIMGNSWMRSLGTVSYGVFLWNMLVLQVFVRIIDQRVFTGSWLLDFTVTWSVSVAIAFVSWQVVERRFLRPRRQAVLLPETDAAP